MRCWVLRRRGFKSRKCKNCWKRQPRAKQKEGEEEEEAATKEWGNRGKGVHRGYTTPMNKHLAAAAVAAAAAAVE